MIQSLLDHNEPYDDLTSMLIIADKMSLLLSFMDAHHTHFGTPVVETDVMMMTKLEWRVWCNKVRAEYERYKEQMECQQ